jgi:hypothetical protein
MKISNSQIVPVLGLVPTYPIDMNTSYDLAMWTLAYYVTLVFGLYLFGSLFFVNLLTNKLFQKEIKIIFGSNGDTSSLGEQRTVGRDRISFATKNVSTGPVNLRRKRVLSLVGPGLFQGRDRSRVANHIPLSTNCSSAPKLIIEQTKL